MRGCERRNGTGCVRSRRGSRPLDLLARCGRVPSARVRANCSSSDKRKKKAWVISCRFSGGTFYARATHDESVKVCLGPFTREISLGSSLRIGYIFGQKRSQRVHLYDTVKITTCMWCGCERAKAKKSGERKKERNKVNNIWGCGE
jgi:hypothetical protein